MKWLLLLLLIPALVFAQTENHRSVRMEIDLPIYAHTSIERVVADADGAVSYRFHPYEPEIVAASSYREGVGFPPVTSTVLRYGLLQFNAAALAGKVIEKVEFFENFNEGSPTGGDTYDMLYYLGDFGSDPLTADEATFQGGALVLIQNAASFTDEQLRDFGDVGVLNFNAGGIVTLRIVNFLNVVAGETSYVGWEYDGAAPCYLKVTYSDAPAARKKIPFLKSGL